MSEPHDDNKLSSEDILRRLIRLARKDSIKEFVRPCNETIDNYLDGTTTDDQREEMEQALIALSAFRKEIRDMAIDIGYIEQEDYSQQMEDEAEISVPDSEKFISEQKLKLEDNKSTDDGFWQKIISLTRLRTTRIAAVAAVAVVIIIAIQSGPVSDRTGEFAKLILVEESVETPLLISNFPRDATSRDTLITYATAKEAALAAFRDILEFDFDTAEFGLLLPRPKAAGELTHKLSVTFVNADGDILASLYDSIPEVTSQRKENLTGWLLTLPGKRLYNIEISGQEIKTTWPSDNGNTGCFTVVVQNSFGYHPATASCLTIK